MILRLYNSLFVFAHSESMPFFNDFWVLELLLIPPHCFFLLLCEGSNYQWKRSLSAVKFLIFVEPPGFLLPNARTEFSLLLSLRMLH